MTTLTQHIKELMKFYIKTNYEKYLQDHSLTYIETDAIPEVIGELYDTRKSHISVFVKTSLAQLLGNEYPGDAVTSRVLEEILEDDTICKNRLITEIKLHQHQILGIAPNYREL
jgi:hypothetical protein